MTEQAVAGETVIDLREVTRRFSGGVVALDGISLEIAERDHVAIVGASGSGKSTLLNVLGLLDRPDEGAYRLAGVDAGSLDERGRAALRGRSLGFVFQAFHLLPYRTVVENVMLGQLYAGVGRPARRQRAEEMLERVGMSHRRDFPPEVLSGGERQRVAIARALAADPKLLLCDEPTGNLDSATTDTVLDVFDELHAEGLTLVVVTHEPAVSERAARVVRLSDGRIIEDVRQAHGS